MHKFTKIFFAVAIVLSTINGAGYSKDDTCAPESHVPQAHKGPTIALVLGGGGRRGAAHLGVLRVLQRENIPIDYIAGSSMGAITGGLYSAGVPLEHIEELIDSNKMQKAYAPRGISTSIVLTVVDAFHLQRADVAIVPDVSGIAVLSDNPEDITRAIKAAEDAAEASLPEIRKAMASWSPDKGHLSIKSGQLVK
jgi:hypothetical protein